MGLQETLDALTERRLAYRAYQAQVDEEMRRVRNEKLGAERASIEHLVAKAAAEGGTTGQIKRAYGTKDHRTVADILKNRAGEIAAIRKSAEESSRMTDWFKIEGDTVVVTVGEHQAVFTWSEVEDELMFVTDTPQWDDTFTTKNGAVALLDGKLESESEQAEQVAAAIRRQ